MTNAERLMGKAIHIRALSAAYCNYGMRLDENGNGSDLDGSRVGIIEHYRRGVASRVARAIEVAHRYGLDGFTEDGLRESGEAAERMDTHYHTVPYLEVGVIEAASPRRATKCNTSRPKT